MRLEVPRDRRAAVRLRPAFRFRVDRQQSNGLGESQQRQGIVERARSLPAAVPGDQDTAADALEVAGVWNYQDRAPAVQDHLFGKGRRIRMSWRSESCWPRIARSALRVAAS